MTKTSKTAPAKNNKKASKATPANDPVTTENNAAETGKPESQKSDADKPAWTHCRAAVFAVVQGTPDATLRTICIASGVCPKSARKHLTDLVADGLAELGTNPEKGNQQVWKPTATGKKLDLEKQPTIGAKPKASKSLRRLEGKKESAAPAPAEPPKAKGGKGKSSPEKPASGKVKKASKKTEPTAQ